MPESFVAEIISPSDPYTLRADDFDTAALAVLLLGNGAYGLRHGELSTPILFGWEEWLAERGIADPADYMALHVLQMAAILDSVLIGSEEERRLVEMVVASLPEGERARWLAERHDRVRTSMNDIGERAAALAEHLRKKAVEA